MSEHSSSHRNVLFLLVGLACVAGFANLLAVGLRPKAGQDAYVPIDPPTAEERAIARAELAAQDRAMKGGQFHDALSVFVEFPGIQQPDLFEVREVDLPDSTPIVGVDVDGSSCAFILSEMSDPTRHIINLMIGETPISVSYCDKVDCVRVLSDDGQSTISLDVGGMDIHNQLVYLFDGQRYGQTSSDLPLADYPFVRMNLGEWKQLHPDTLVCMLVAP